MQVLAGDIGGTKTLLAICEVTAARSGAPHIDVLQSARFDSRAYPGLGAICREFVAQAQVPMPAQAAFGVAGPVRSGRSHTTNLPWIVDEQNLKETLGIERVRLLNDFLALGLGISAVQPGDLVTLNEGVRDPRGPWAILGAGTGLGEAIAVVTSAGLREALPTEGGHCSFGPRNEVEIGILRFLLRRYEHVSWERLCSGEGLVNIAEALHELSALPFPQPLAHALAEDRTNAPAVVTAQAEAKDPLCRMAMETFCSLYGAEAGNLALKALATGGVFVAGGIAPRIVDFLRDGRFREAFLAKGRMRPMLEQMPVQVVLDDEAGLLGAALAAGTRSSPHG